MTQFWGNDDPETGSSQRMSAADHYDAAAELVAASGDGIPTVQFSAAAIAHALLGLLSVEMTRTNP